MLNVWKLNVNFLLNQINKFAIDLMEVTKGIVSNLVTDIRSLKWCLPPENKFKVNVDGSVRRNLAAAGGLIRDDKGNWILGFVEGSDNCSVLMTEILAIRKGLKFAWERHLPLVIIESDSSQAVELINGFPDPNHSHYE